MKEDKIIEEIINDLTINGQYANDICLILLINQRYETLNYLHSLNIKGKDLEILTNNCCFEDSLECFTQTVRYLRSGFLDKKTIFSNLRSSNPIPFIHRLLKSNEDWDLVYEDYTFQFMKNFNQNKTR